MDNKKAFKVYTISAIVGLIILIVLILIVGLTRNKRKQPIASSTIITSTSVSEESSQTESSSITITSSVQEVTTQETSKPLTDKELEIERLYMVADLRAALEKSRAYIKPREDGLSVAFRSERLLRDSKEYYRDGEWYPINFNYSLKHPLKTDIIMDLTQEQIVENELTPYDKRSKSYSWLTENLLQDLIAETDIYSAACILGYTSAYTIGDQSLVMCHFLDRGFKYFYAEGEQIYETTEEVYRDIGGRFTPPEETTTRPSLHPRFVGEADETTIATTTSTTSSKN